MINNSYWLADWKPELISGIGKAHRMEEQPCCFGLSSESVATDEITRVTIYTRLHDVLGKNVLDNPSITNMVLSDVFLDKNGIPVGRSWEEVLGAQLRRYVVRTRLENKYA